MADTKMPLYFDESIREHGQFTLGAYVCGPDPTDDVDAALRGVGLEPGHHEFKSSAVMSERPEQQALRVELRKILRSAYRFGVVIVPSQERLSLGREALVGLAKICHANGLTEGMQSAYFDAGVFSSTREALELADQLGVSRYCGIHPGQDSRRVKGLQLADLVAHTCGTMLLDALGLITKLVKATSDLGYGTDLDLEVGFELWAGVRWQFFNGGLPDKVESNEDMVVDVASYGLNIADSCSPDLCEAALARFGKQYLGCIH